MRTNAHRSLKSEYEFATRELQRRRLMVERLRKERTKAYYNGYKQGRYDEKMKQEGYA